MDLKKTAEDLLNKSIKLEDVELTKEQVEELEGILESMKKSSLDATGVDTGESFEMSTEVIKFDKCGQWKIEKAIKPGPALDYKKINTIDNKDSEANARTIDNKDSEANARTIDYSTHESGPKIERRNAVRNKQEQRRVQGMVKPKSAIDTMSDGGQIKKPKV